MTYGKIALGAVCASLAVVGCGPVDEARQRQTAAVDKLSSEADRAVGMPALSQWQQKKLVRDIYERTDRATTTFAYVQGLDGRLTCLGRGIGYGVPYGTRSTPPEDFARYSGGTVADFAFAQPEPNGLYLPDNASATWWQMLNPANGKIEVVYLEPTIVIVPFQITGPAVAAACA